MRDIYSLSRGNALAKNRHNSFHELLEHPNKRSLNQNVNCLQNFGYRGMICMIYSCESEAVRFIDKVSKLVNWSFFFSSDARSLTLTIELHNRSRVWKTVMLLLFLHINNS